MISIIVPFYNEEANAPVLCRHIRDVMDGLRQPYEVVCINDGSSDGTEAALRAVASVDIRFKLINFSRNFGQTAALMAGFDHSVGEIVVPLDGDLQNDPADIPRLLAKLDEGFSIVSGWRKDRKDARFSRAFLSRVANILISRISGVRLHDYGCTLKAYRRDVIKDVRLYGEMHRFIPIFAHWHGARVTELPVRHRPRTMGRSHYGLSRIFKVLLDIMVVKFFEDLHVKPIYVFGGAGLISLVLSFLSGFAAVWLRLVDGVPLILTPLPLLCVLTFVVSILFTMLGLISEMLVRIHYGALDRRAYVVRSAVNI